MQKQDWTNGKRLCAWAGLSALFVALRCLLVLPWVYLEAGRNKELTTLLRCAVTLVLWLFMVLPAHRFCGWAAMRLRGEDGGSFSYPGELRLGLHRFLRVSGAAVPSAALGLLLYYTLAGSNLKTLAVLRDIGSVGTLLGMPERLGYDMGFGIVLVSLMIFLVVLAVLWFRGTPNDYLGTLRPFRRARFDRRAFVSFLLAAIAYVLWAVILYLHMAPIVSGVNGLMRKATRAVNSFDEIFAQRAFAVEMLLVLILVYCPLWCLRKNSAARAAAEMRDAA